jgi:threonine/homoserine/homoserine lactone efflux protein
MNGFAAFLLVAAGAMLIPGPDTLVVLRTALAGGSGAGTWAAAGSGLGNVVWGSASVSGVAGLMAASGAAFDAARLAGAVYLCFLGAQALVAAVRGSRFAADPAGAGTTRGTAFRRGLASDLLNVKVGMFWTALMPQFVSPDASRLLPLAMVAAMGALAFGWLAAYAQLAGRVRDLLTRPAASRAVNGVAAVALIALGPVMLA